MIPERLFTKDLNGKFLFIRHGQTDGNVLSKHCTKDEIHTDITLANIGLNETGIIQARNAGNTLLNLEIEEVYVSPIKRALETAYYLFENHPRKDNLVIKVHPWIFETLGGILDFPFNLQESKSIFNLSSKVKFDWSVFDSYYKHHEYEDLFYFDYIDIFDDATKTHFYNKLSLSYHDTNEYLSVLKDMVVTSINLGYDRWETKKAMWRRNIKYKEYLKNKFPNHKENDGKVISVTHSSLCKIATSKWAYTKEIISELWEDEYLMDNCEIISMHIE